MKAGLSESPVRRVGVHTSIAGGIHLSMEKARTLGCSTVQIFSHNPRQWHINKIPENDVVKFKELRKAFNINPVFIHTSYLINLASSNEEVIKKSAELLIHEMDIADTLSADYVILHTGSASSDPAEAGRQRAIEALGSVLINRQWKSKLLLENTAGERGDISSKMSDLGEIINRVNSSMIGGVCIDTCHAFSAGYDIREDSGLSGLVREIDEHIGLHSVKVIHLNDSKKTVGSGVDRHEHIGIGGIGIKGLKRFLKHPAFKDIPLILETPKKNEDDDQRNLKKAAKLLSH